jgi:hypothetical protein
MLLPACLAAGAIVTAASAMAHHSFSMFDFDKPTELEGTVQEFRYTNPHTMLLLRVKGKEGGTATWSLEGMGPSSLERDGWTSRSLRPGDQIKVTIWPLQSGATGGVWYTQWIHFRDGRAISAGK